jgi:hypothetical protein
MTIYGQRSILLCAVLYCTATIAFAQVSSLRSAPPNTAAPAASDMDSPCDPSKQDTSALRWPTHAEAWAQFIEEVGGLDNNAHRTGDPHAISSNDLFYIDLNRQDIGLSPSAWQVAYTAMIVTYYQVKSYDERYGEAKAQLYEKPPTRTQQQVDEFVRERPAVYKAGVAQLRATISSADFNKMDSFVCRRPGALVPMHIEPNGSTYSDGTRIEEPHK